MNVFFPHESITRGKRLNAIVLFIKDSYGIHKGCIPHMEPSRGGRPRSITPTQRRACVRAITIGGLDNAIDARNALSEHLNVVVSTNTVRHALHEACLGSVEKQKKPLLTTKNVCCKLEVAQRQQDGTIHDWYRVIFSDEIMVTLGVGWGMENINYKLIMWIIHLNMELVQFLCGDIWLPMAWITCAR